MKFKLKLIIMALSMFIFTNAVSALPFRADARTRRIPAGTRLRLELIDPVTSFGSSAGDYFNAMLLDDQKAQTNIVLPAGSIVRGSLSKVVKARRLSRGAIVYLEFDHVVTPNGRQIPLALSVYGRTDLTLDGGIYGSKGYGEALQNSWKKSVNITKTATNFGADIGDNAFTGAKYVTIPVCAVGGAFGGGAFMMGDSVADLFKKGKDVLLNKGTILEVQLTYPIDVPVN
ncbi:hypothetical protein KBA27_03715 [bacterium]|nr:hypothetical protein [bacterium]